MSKFLMHSSSTNYFNIIWANWSWSAFLSFVPTRTMSRYGHVSKLWSPLDNGNFQLRILGESCLQKTLLEILRISSHLSASVSGRCIVDYKFSVCVINPNFEPWKPVWKLRERPVCIWILAYCKDCVMNSIRLIHDVNMHKMYHVYFVCQYAVSPILQRSYSQLLPSNLLISVTITWAARLIRAVDLPKMGFYSNSVWRITASMAPSLPVYWGSRISGSST